MPSSFRLSAEDSAASAASSVTSRQLPSHCVLFNAWLLKVPQWAQVVCFCCVALVCAGAPVRLPVQDVFKGRQGGTCVGGKLEAGALRPSSKVLVVPGYVTATVKGLEVNSQV